MKNVKKWNTERTEGWSWWHTYKQHDTSNADKETIAKTVTPKVKEEGATAKK